MARQRWVAFGVAAVAVLCACGRPAGRVAAEAPGAPRRIVSLAPSLTETLFAIGAGDRVVGVTRYCAHPHEVASLPRVGGHLDPNLEAVVALEPDLVVAIPSSADIARRVESLGIPVLLLDQGSVAAILESVSVLAGRCGVSARGAELRAEMERRLDRVRSRIAGAPRPRVVVVVGHQSGGGEVGAVWAAGRDTFYDEVLEIAGGDNVVDVRKVRFPELSREGLAALDPEVVLDVMAEAEVVAADLDRLRRSWRRLTELQAVRRGRVHLLVGGHLVVPGPRLPLMVESIARTLHPGLEWGPE